MARAFCKECDCEREGAYIDPWVCTVCGTRFGLKEQRALAAASNQELLHTEDAKREEKKKKKKWTCTEPGCDQVNNASRTTCRGKNCDGERPW